MKEKDTKQPWWQPGLVLFVELSGWIVAPVLIAVYVGRWLDDKYQTEPWLFILSVGVAFIISNIGIVKQSIKSMKKIDKENKKDEQAK